MKAAIRIGTLFVMLVVLPMLGVWAVGLPVARYLEFPPLTRYVVPAPFSWIAFVGYGLFVLGWVVTFGRQAVRTWLRVRGSAANVERRHFPWWGWLGVALGVVGWVLAWTRFAWFAPLQAHTFTPLWIAYVLVINALTWRRTGRCMLVNRTRFFLLLFPLSAAFWWFFEYLNRFVQNWYYVHADFGPLGYFLYATLPFATVLPAVLGTRDWLRSFPVIEQGFGQFHPMVVRRPRLVGGVVLLVTASGLAMLGVEPDFLSPLLWISPLLILVCVKAMLGQRQVFSPVTRGDWRTIVASAIAALVCGFFWEMWNYGSLAQWHYAVPFLQRFKIFEMPLIGYAGYLPFGLECTVVAAMLEPEA